MSSVLNLKPISEIPGPEEKPGKGNIEDINQAGDLARFQLALHQQYGHLVKFKLNADTLVVSTTDTRALKACSKIFDKPESLYHFLDPLIGNIMFLPEQRNKEVRKFVIEKFSPSLIQKKFDVLVKQLNLEIDDWISESQKTEGILSIQEKLKALSMKLTIILTCGEEFSESAKFANCIQTTLQESLNLQYLKADRGHSEQKLREALAYIEEKINAFISRRQNLQEQNKNEVVLLDELLKFTDDRTEMKNILKLVLMGGYHTIASAVSWTLYALAKYPEVAQKVYGEIDSITNQNPFRFVDLPKLKYLANVMKETLRIYPSGPYTARQADTDLEIGGYLIPKDTIIFYPIWAVHTNPEYWPNPEKFDPDRFSNHHNRSAYLPFGFGARNCTGANIANVEVLLMLEKIAERLELHELPDFKPLISENFVLMSKNDIQLKITPRAKEKSPINAAYLGSSLTLGVFIFAVLYNTLNDEKFALMLSVILASSFYYSLSRNGAAFFNNEMISKSSNTKDPHYVPDPHSNFHP